MKKIIVLALSLVFALGILNTGVYAVVNPKFTTNSISRVVIFWDDVNTTKSPVFTGKIVNKTKYLAKINKLYLNIVIVSANVGNFTYNDKITPGVKNSPLTYKNTLPSVIKPGSLINYKVICSSGSKDLIAYNYPLLASEYAKTTSKVDLTLTAKTIKISKLYQKAATSSKVLKTLKSGVAVIVLDVAAKGLIKVKVGTTTGYVLVSNIK